MFAEDTMISDEVYQTGPIFLKEGTDNQGIKTYYTAKHNVYPSFSEAMLLVSRVFESKPFFIKDDVAWMQEYLQAFAKCYSYMDRDCFPKLRAETVYENVFNKKTDVLPNGRDSCHSLWWQYREF